MIAGAASQRPASNAPCLCPVRAPRAALASPEQHSLVYGPGIGGWERQRAVDDSWRQGLLRRQVGDVQAQPQPRAQRGRRDQEDMRQCARRAGKGGSRPASPSALLTPVFPRPAPVQPHLPSHRSQVRDNRRQRRVCRGGGAPGVHGSARATPLAAPLPRPLSRLPSANRVQGLCGQFIAQACVDWKCCKEDSDELTTWVEEKTFSDAYPTVGVRGIPFPPPRPAEAGQRGGARIGTTCPPAALTH